ncbi:MAG TPA: arylsulfatase [Dinghuibacter sp.]|uniref:arylsulfatase n=1 Tax=Dinghuibacter sp. TaxID=2024697 RepID=UPI002C9D751F|nr:arylsulfatase [Dinghuibacter sp.]HTJ10668.1 arylsulfatase [Dinghuibacter sp.]
MKTLRILLGTAALWAAVPVAAQQAQHAQQRPNIVFILADDLGYGDTGPYGQQLIRTPNIDKLAAQGMTFTQMYAGTAVCAPSRCALLTGRHTGHAYIRGNKEIQPEGQEPLPDTTVTMAAVLHRAGYVTGAFGKWGLGPVGSAGDPVRQGFDEFYGYNCQREAHRYYPSHLWDNDRRVDLPENGHLEREATYAPDVIQQKLLGFIDAHAHGQPFFLYAAYTLPHAELAVPDDSIFESYKGRFPEKPHRGNDYGPQAVVAGYQSQLYPQATYAAMVTRLDLYVGQIMARLRALGIDKNTLVIFTSDNGPSGEGGNDPVFFHSADGLRGAKRDLYEGGIREPFIARWPGHVRAGSQNAFVGAFWDMMPTFAALAGTRSPWTDGLSMAPTFTGKGTQTVHPWLYWEFHEDGGKQAVRQGRWKGVRTQVDKGDKFELFDLLTDPGERHDVSAQHPDVTATLTGIMQAEHTPSALFPFAGEHRMP